MKNSLSLFTALFIFLISSVNTISQWQPDVRLSNDLGSSFSSNSNSWSIAANGNIVHVAWVDRPSGQFAQIYYKRSTDGGITWGDDVHITHGTWFFTGDPSIAVAGSDVYISFIYNHYMSDDLFCWHSTDAGVSWIGNPGLIAFNKRKQTTMSASGSGIHIISPHNDNFLYYIRSINDGFNWSDIFVLIDSTGHPDNPSVGTNGLNVHLVWNDSRDGNNEIYYKHSTDGGDNWTSDTRLTNNPASSTNPCAGVLGPFVHVVWQDNRDGNYEIYYKRSTDNGTTWGPDTRLTISSDSSCSPSISVSNSHVHVGWQDKRDGNWEIYYKQSSDEGVTWSADTRLTNNSAVSQLPSLAASGPSVHVLWTDTRDGSTEIYYKRNPTGNPEGIVNINSEIPKSFSVSQNYPNPFNPSTKIRFSVPDNVSPLYARPRMNPSGERGAGGFITLSVYDVLGRQVSSLVSENLKPGTYEVDWNASNFPSGVYYYKLSAGSTTQTKKMVLIK